MKTYLLIVAIVCLCVTTAKGAHLVAQTENSGLWGQIDREIITDHNQALSSPVSLADPTHVEATLSEYFGDTEAVAEMYGNVGSTEGHGMSLAMLGRSGCSGVNNTASMWAYADVSAVVPANTCGVFFTIVPDEGESIGTNVRVQLYWYGYSNCNNPAIAEIGAFNTNWIYVTRNVQPPVNFSPESGVVWSKEMPDLTEGFDGSDGGSFIAQIGDTVGVFMNVRTRAEVVGSGTSIAEVSTRIELSADVLPTLIEYPYAPGLVYDPDQNITLLKDWSAAGVDLNWNDANDWAANFTYVSNSVTYSNWRLPRTIEGSPWSGVGELGYLASNYGISSQYFGPFTNLLDGDYWTAPQFSRNPDPIAYAYTFSTIYGPAQWESPLSYQCYVIPVFDGPPQEWWCPADFDKNGIVDFADFATFASYWLNERPR